MSKVKDIINNEVLKLINSQESLPWENPNFFESKMNIDTGSIYSGVNKILLYGTDKYFISVNSAKKHGIDFAGVKTKMVVYYSKTTIKDKESQAEKDIFLMRYYRVLPILACKNIPNKFLKKISKFEQENKDIKTIEGLETLIGLHNPKIIDIFEGSNFYRPSDDTIGLRKKESFKSTEMYYSTLLHELVHWTGHQNRLNRLDSGYMDNHNRSIEELIAEIGSSYIKAEYGLELTDNNRAYIKGWFKKDIDISSVFSKCDKVYNYIKSPLEI